MDQDIRNLIAKYGFRDVYNRFYEELFLTHIYLNSVFQESISCVYGIFRKVDHLCIYIGSSTHIHNRIQWHHHDTSLFPTRNLYMIITESGGWKNFYFKVIEKVHDISIMFMREKYYNQIYKPIGNSANVPNVKNNISLTIFSS